MESVRHVLQIAQFASPTVQDNAILEDVMSVSQELATIHVLSVYQDAIAATQPTSQTVSVVLQVPSSTLESVLSVPSPAPPALPQQCVRPVSLASTWRTTSAWRPVPSPAPPATPTTTV